MYLNYKWWKNKTKKTDHISYSEHRSHQNVETIQYTLVYTIYTYNCRHQLYDCDGGGYWWKCIWIKRKSVFKNEKLSNLLLKILLSCVMSSFHKHCIYILKKMRWKEKPKQQNFSSLCPPFDQHHCRYFEDCIRLLPFVFFIFVFLTCRRRRRKLCFNIFFDYSFFFTTVMYRCHEYFGIERYCISSLFFYWIKCFVVVVVVAQGATISMVQAQASHNNNNRRNKVENLT